MAPMGTYPQMPQGQAARGAMGEEEESAPSAGAYVPPRLAVPSPARPVVRGQMPDAPAPLTAPVMTPAPAPVPERSSPPAPVSMPAPASFGLAPAEDWTTCLEQLEKLGLVGCQVLEAPGGGCQFVYQLRTAEPGRHYRIESGPAATKTAAIKLALADA